MLSVAEGHIDRNTYLDLSKAFRFLAGTLCTRAGLFFCDASLLGLSRLFRGVSLRHLLPKSAVHPGSKVTACRNVRSEVFEGFLASAALLEGHEDEQQQEHGP